MGKPQDWNDLLRKLVAQYGEEEGRKRFQQETEEADIDALVSITTHIEDKNPELKIINELNSKHVFINNFAGKSAVTVRQYSEVTEQEELAFLPLDTFKNCYLNRTIGVNGKP